MRDTAAMLDFLGSQESIVGARFGCTGYCMGGHYAVVAAGTFPDRIAAAASFHGGNLATDRPDSPHLLADHMRATLYVGVAGIDPHFSPEEKDRLEAALSTSGVPHTIEVYPDVRHGFAVADLPVYDREAAEKHWQRLLGLLELLRETGAPR
jgi:carboxymethylenebutenolidase